MTPQGRIGALAQSRERREGRIDLQVEGAIARLVIDNPRARGALTLHMMLDLCRAVEALEACDAAVLLLESSDPRSFCSGGHLDEVQEALFAPDRGEQMSLAMGEALDALLALPMISVSVVDGPAIGGGAELATATDFRLAGPRARIQFVQARMGVAPGWGGGRRLADLVGRRVALRILAGGSLSAEEALGLGLVDGVLEDVAEDVARFIRPWTKLTTSAVRALKGQVVARDRATDAAWFASVWGGPEHRAALDRRKG